MSACSRQETTCEIAGLSEEQIKIPVVSLPTYNWKEFRLYRLGFMVCPCSHPTRHAPNIAATPVLDSLYSYGIAFLNLTIAI